MKTTFTETKAWEVIKAALIAVIVTLIAILVSSLIIKLSGLSTSSVAIFDIIIIKILSLLIGCFFGFKSGEKGWLKGIFTGLVFVLLSYITFGIMSGSYDINVKFAYNVLLGVFSGMISGMCVSIMRK